MDSVSAPEIIGCGLNRREREKLDRVAVDLILIFISIGCTVRVCEATGDSERRTLHFLQDFGQSPIASFDAAEFMSCTVEELEGLIRKRIPISRRIE